MHNNLINFIYDSPTAFQCIDNSKNILINNGFKEIKENQLFKIERGKKYFISRNGTSLISFVVGKNVDESYNFHIVASHSDSPCFKVKPVCDTKTGSYNKVNVEPYGGMLCSTWLDRPLSFAGRVFIREKDKIIIKLVNIKKPCALIPNICIHFNRDANNGFKYNAATDMQPFISQNIDGEAFYKLIADEMGCEIDSIVNFDLFLYNNEKGIIWGKDAEFISSPRLDDLECAYTSLMSFIESENDNDINVHVIFDNEEVGSRTLQGADSDFLVNTLKRINESLGFSNETYLMSLNGSFMISADNAHAIHPNHPELTDSNNAATMNKGIVIKFNASQSYTSDGYSSSVMKEICKKADVPTQEYTNRADIRGGSTLGNISTTHLSIKSVDIGLAQLAMHSSFETAGSKDIDYLYKALKYFYSHSISINDESFEIK